MSRKVVFITGASAGIGRACAIAFCAAGFDVAGMARNRERLAEVSDAVKHLPTPHGDFLALPGDVRHVESVRDSVARAVEAFGSLDTLVANAGVGHSGAVVDADWNDLQLVMDTNIHGVLHCIRECAPVMRANGGGQIIIVSSVVAGIHTPYTAIYAASKAFVSSLAGSLRLELEDDDISVSDVWVGTTATEFSANRVGDVKREMSGLPTMSAEAVADAIVRLTRRPRKRAILRPLDRLIVWGGIVAPGILARFAKRRYEPRD